MLAGSTAVSGTRVEGVPGDRSGWSETVARRFPLVVGGLTAAVAAFLLLQLHAWPPHEDETLALFVSHQPLGDLFATVIGERGGAPLHFLLSHLVSALSPGLTGLRLISVAFAVASVPVVAALVRRLAGERTALVAVFVAAASWILLFHGIYARMYSVFLFTSTLSFLVLVAAVDRGGARRWALWIGAILLTIATQPYGALVMASQAAYVLYRRKREGFSLVLPAAAFGAALALATPLWLTYSRLAERFDVGLTGAGSKLGSPLDVLLYLGEVVGDFTAGWLPALIVVGAIALIGLVSLWRERRGAAVLALASFLVPAATFLAFRSRASVSLESRHLIFALPFFAMMLGAGLVSLAATFGRGRRFALPLAVLAVVGLQIAWGLNKTPALYAGENDIRRESRAEASAWIAATSRDDDVYFGYEPLYLEAWGDGADIGMIVQRADPKLALDTLRETAKPLGRGVWVFDATDQEDRSKQQLTIPEAAPGPAFEARAFGPFLVLRTKQQTRTIETFLYETAEVQMLGKKLGIGDAGINHQTALAALVRLRDGR